MWQPVQHWLATPALDEIQVVGMTIGRVIAIALVILLATAAMVATRYLLLRSVMRILPRSRKRWGEILIKRRVFHLLAGLTPAFVIAAAAPLVLEGNDRWTAIVGELVGVYVVALSTLIVNAGVNAALEIYESYPLSKLIPLTSLAQATKVVVFVIAGLAFLSFFLGISPIILIGGFSAVLATLSFVLRDPILGLIASIQLAANNMVAIGDRIEMPQHKADGDVLEIGLTTVKVRNFDQTISTIPTYALVSESVKNWHPMKESGGRRLKRSIYIDVSTVKFCTMEMLQNYIKMDYVASYIEGKKKELAAQNPETADASAIDLADLVNGRHLTNLGAFRAYITGFLCSHPKINQEMERLARVRPPTAYGIPIEIYAYSSETSFVEYETVQSEIVDHIVAIAPEFGLRVFQYPAGSDLQALSETGVEVR